VKFTSELRDATCQWNHTVLSDTRLHPNRAGWYSIYRPRKDERLSWPRWVISGAGYIESHPASHYMVLPSGKLSGIIPQPLTYWKLPSTNVPLVSSAACRVHCHGIELRC